MRKILLAPLIFLASLSSTLSAAPGYWYFGGEAASVKNVDDALVANIRSGQTANEFARMASRTPIIWARYNPGTGIGTIIVTRTFRRPDGSTDIALTPFKPADGTKFSTGGVGRSVIYFGGVNPFGAFDAGDEYFRNINFTAFLAATGLVMRAVNSSVTFVYHPALTPLPQGTTAGNETQYGDSGNVSYRAEGRWLMALAVESGDRGGFVPAYRVQGCNPVIDLRNACIVKGFASFVPWNDGNLPTASMTLGSRSSSSVIDTTGMAALFSGIENFVREGSLWNDSAWSSMANSNSIPASLYTQTTTIALGDIGRRDKLTEVGVGGTSSLSATVTNGIFLPGATNVWDFSDAATTEFILKPLNAAGAGAGVTATQANWQQTRDRNQVADVLNKEGTTAGRRTVFNASPQ